MIFLVSPLLIASEEKDNTNGVPNPRMVPAHAKYGHFNLIIKGFICKRFGESSWELIATQCGCDRDFKDREFYNDGMTQELIDTAVQVLTLDREQFLFLTGEHYLDQLRIKHDEVLRNLGENMLDFLQNVDYLHTYAMSDYPDINMPSFRCEADSQADNMVVHYYSFRPGLYPFVEGILHAVAHVYFKSDLAVTVISRSIDEVSGHGTSRHHVVFNLKLTKMKARSEAPPTLIAQTQKGVEKQILKTDIDRVLQRLREIRTTQGEDAMPLNKSKVARAKWRSLAKMSVLYSGFVPQYPMTLTFNAKAFCDAFPYHIVFNQQMVVVHSGVKIQELMPGIRALRAHLPDFCVLVHPTPMDFTFENVTKFINTPFILKTQPHKMQKLWGKKPMVKFRGQMLMADQEDHIIYLCSPFVRCLHDLEERNMKLADIPVHDVTRDMLWVELFARMRRGHGDSTLSRRNSVAVGISGMIAHAGEDDFNSNDPMVLRRLLLAARQDLADERKQREEVSRAFLPPAYLRGIQEGQTDQAGQFQFATVLFCDVVHFAQILVHCSPPEVVRLLTDLHQKFNRVCRVHQSFRVEAIGDAYMVVSGAPDTVESHPERMANTALGMIIAAREVNSPYDYGDEDNTAVQIRVGLCTGPVVCGVVGDVTPRCLVFGPAVNMASRLESHGVAGRVHTNQETKEILAKRGFRIEKRGTIDLRGMGRVKTFFVESNTRCSEYEIMGRQRGSRSRTANGVSVTFINDGRFENPGTPHGTNSSNSPLLSSNKVSPTNAVELGRATTVLMVYKDAIALPATTQALKVKPEVHHTQQAGRGRVATPAPRPQGIVQRTYSYNTLNDAKTKPAKPENYSTGRHRVETVAFASRNDVIHYQRNRQERQREEPLAAPCRYNIVNQTELTKPRSYLSGRHRTEMVTFASRNDVIHPPRNRQEPLAAPCKYNSINQRELTKPGSYHSRRHKTEMVTFTSRNDVIRPQQQREEPLAAPCKYNSINQRELTKLRDYHAGRHRTEMVTFASRNDVIRPQQQREEPLAAPCKYNSINQRELTKFGNYRAGKHKTEMVTFASRNDVIRPQQHRQEPQTESAKPKSYSVGRQRPEPMAFKTRNNNVHLSSQMKKSETGKPESYHTGRQRPEPMAFATRNNSVRSRTHTKKPETVQPESYHGGRQRPEPMSFSTRNKSIHIGSQTTRPKSENYFIQHQSPEHLARSAPGHVEPGVFSSSRDAGPSTLLAYTSRKDTVHTARQNRENYYTQGQLAASGPNPHPGGMGPASLPAEGVLCELMDFVSKINQPVGWAMRNEMIRQGYNE